MAEMYGQDKICRYLFMKIWEVLYQCELMIDSDGLPEDVIRIIQRHIISWK